MEWQWTEKKTQNNHENTKQTDSSSVDGGTSNTWKWGIKPFLKETVIDESPHLKGASKKADVGQQSDSKGTDFAT